MLIWDVLPVLDHARPANQPISALHVLLRVMPPTQLVSVSPSAEMASSSAQKLVIPAVSTQLDVSTVKSRVVGAAQDSLQSADQTSSPLPLQ